MAENGEMSVVGKALLDFTSKWMLPLVLAFVSWQYTEINKLEDRVIELQKVSVTHTELQVTENRMVGLLDLRVKNLADQQEITNKYLKILIDQKSSRP
ncbi:hypothetical protein [Pseudomonas sp. P8_250]|uniref:hypothetical protein n=1 Tax=Pseudomonas sp. P8_250 TaxID=3043446 RepID=UPI002A3712ED|nr:hypothetical protein [Pseudomonas sp. P8_250]MDX9668753.1 hypothetical protein [Pseudomonas sp. P8_250]